MRHRSGFTLPEALIVLVLIGILSAVVVPKTEKALHRARVSHAATIVASDLEQAFTLAARQRKPMQVACDCPNATYTVREQFSPYTIYLTRNLSDLHVGVSFLPDPLVVPPSGLASASLLVILLAGESNRSVAVSRSGWVRVLP